MKLPTRAKCDAVMCTAVLLPPLVNTPTPTITSTLPYSKSFFLLIKTLGCETLTTLYRNVDTICCESFWLQ